MNTVLYFHAFILIQKRYIDSVLLFLNWIGKTRSVWRNDEHFINGNHFGSIGVSTAWLRRTVTLKFLRHNLRTRKKIIQFLLYVVFFFFTFWDWNEALYALFKRKPWVSTQKQLTLVWIWIPNYLESERTMKFNILSTFQKIRSSNTNDFE